jgi:tetratricopeptide (TPR) repeat protein
MKKIIVALLIFCAAYSQEEQSVQNLSRFIQANYHQFGNNLKQAGHWYEQITPDQHAQHIYLGYIPFLDASHSYQEIVTLIPTLDEFFKKNNDIQLLFAMALEKSGKLQESYSRLIQLNERNKTNQELAFKVAQLYMEQKEPENALKVIDNFLNSSPRRPNNFIFQFMRAQIYIQCNQPELALAATTLCIELYPKFDKSWLLYAILHEQEGKLEQAIQGYKNYLEISTEPQSEIEQHLLALAFKQKIENKSITPYSKNCVEDALQLFEKKEYTKALYSIDQCLNKETNNTQAKLLKVQILVALANYELLSKTLLGWIIDNPQQELWIEIAHTATYLGMPYKNALQLLKKAESKVNNKELCQLYQADLALRMHAPLLALPLLLDLQKNSKNPSVQAQSAFQAALIYYDQKKIDVAIELLESRATHDFNPADNLLAYCYALKNKKLDPALALCQQALLSDPENPHFLDTYALVLFKQKKYAQALSFFQKAAAACPGDLTISTNMARCQAACNNRQSLAPMRHASNKRLLPRKKRFDYQLKTQWAKQ